MIEGAFFFDLTLAIDTPFPERGILRTNTEAACGHDKLVVLAKAADVGPWLPAASCTEFALRRAMRVPAPVQRTETVIVDPLLTDGVKEQPVAVPVFERSDDDKPETDSLNVNVNEDDNPLLVALDHDAVGGVVSDSGTVTVMDAVPPFNVVCAFPATSLAENAPDAVIDDDTDPPPDVAVEVALTRQVVEFV